MLHFLVDFHLLQNKNCDSNLRLAVDEASNCKLLTVYISLFKYFNIHGVSKHHLSALQKFELKKILSNFLTIQHFSQFITLLKTSHLHPLDGDRNARPVVGEDLNGKFRRESLP